jgi:ubiquinone/menaquinone biosynthesis C-methylase UbiE
MAEQMSEIDKIFTGSIAENYDRLMVPLIFEPFAADIAQRAASLSPIAVLEIAAGSGVVTRALAPRRAAAASLCRNRPQSTDARLRRRAARS